MSVIITPYTAMLADLSTGILQATTTIGGLLLRTSYAFDPAHADLSMFAADELADPEDAGYARCLLDSTFTVAPAGAEIQYTDLTPQIAFTAFTSTDWRYVLLFNIGSGAPYLLLDTGATNTSADTTLTVAPGADPYARLLIAP